MNFNFSEFQVIIVIQNVKIVSFILIWGQILQLWQVEEGSDFRAILAKIYQINWTRNFDSNHGETKIEFQPVHCEHVEPHCLSFLNSIFFNCFM